MSNLQNLGGLYKPLGRVGERERETARKEERSRHTYLQ